MHLETGRRLGPYEITGAIGAGGMGEVYRARDTRLGREVAIKVLPAEVSRNPERLVRFEREARSASALNHRNIVTIHDFTSSDGEAWLVMELIRGASLRDLLSAGPLPMKRLLSIASGVADGLGAAHAAGLVHRDLKPENIMVGDDGTSKILDFGLVKQVVSRTDPDAATEAYVSRTGVIVGTATYMSPEQARGEELDFRTDQFSLGIILHEAATGAHPFRRATAAETISAILNEEPKPLPPDVPEAFAWIVERCLAKKPGERYGSTVDLAHDLERLHRAGSASRSALPAAPRRGRRAFALAALAVSLAVAGVLAGMALRSSARQGFTDPIVSAIPTPEIAAVMLEAVGQPLALSPDGRQLAIYGADATGATGLWVRDLRTGVTKKVAARAFSAAWSADGKGLAYFADGKLMTVAADGGPARTVCAARPEGTPTWHGDTILYAQYSLKPGIWAVNATGGEPRRLVDPAGLPWWPQFLPGGKHFLYIRFVPRPDLGEIGHELYIASRDGTVKRRLATMDSRAAFANGHLLFVRDGTLLAQPFDPETGTLSGEAQAVVEGVHYFGNTGAAAFTASDNGVLAWRVARRPVRLAWFDRSGVEGETIGSALMTPDGRISPDGRHYVVGVVDAKHGSGDLWIYDLERGSAERLTYKGLDEASPVWAPDGRSVFYRSDGGGGPPDIFRWVLGSASGAIYYSGPAVEEPHDVSPDGTSLLFTQARQVEGADVHRLPLQPDARPVPVLTSPFNESSPRFSPDGRWIAYESEASGAPEIYVRPASATDASARVLRVSQQGGTRPRWRRDGRELLFLAPGGKLMSLGFDEKGTPGTPTILFGSASMVDFDISADGKRFLVQLDEQSSEPVVHLLINWPERLKRK